ncbi:MAG: sulfur carrier protein ThiS [Lachnospira sp.]|nr:sulfur carrier protein ThiS [Lachnospira sp.]
MIQINGDKVEDTSIIGKTLLAYITEAGYDPLGIVIEKNMEIIHREDFDKVNIADGDVIEILHFVGGGQF